MKISSFIHKTPKSPSTISSYDNQPFIQPPQPACGCGTPCPHLTLWMTTLLRNFDYPTNQTLYQALLMTEEIDVRHEIQILRDLGRTCPKNDYF